MTSAGMVSKNEVEQQREVFTERERENEKKRSCFCYCRRRFTYIPMTFSGICFGVHMRNKLTDIHIWCLLAALCLCSLIGKKQNHNLTLTCLVDNFKPFR